MTRGVCILIFHPLFRTGLEKSIVTGISLYDLIQVKTEGFSIVGFYFHHKFQSTKLIGVQIIISVLLNRRSWENRGRHETAPAGFKIKDNSVI